MRIAQVAPLYESVPPKLYGGTERVVSYLTEELVREGHEVTLFASGDSETAAALVPGCPRALWRDPNCRETLPRHVRLVERVAREAHRFDVIHFHLDYVHFPIVGQLPCATVTTLHGRQHPPDHQALFEAYPEVPLVSISDDQRRPVPEANWRATVYHGLPRDVHTFRESPGTYLAFLGRVSPEKGLDLAVAQPLIDFERAINPKRREFVLLEQMPHLCEGASDQRCRKRGRGDERRDLPCCFSRMGAPVLERGLPVHAGGLLPAFSIPPTPAESPCHHLASG